MASSTGVGRRARISSVSHAASTSLRNGGDVVGSLGRGEIDAILRGQRPGDAQVLLNQRSPGNRRRMCGQHQLHAQRRGCRVQRIRRHARGEQARERLVARAALRRRRRVAQIFAPAANPVVLLGDVRERQKMRERARDGHGRFDRQRTKQFRQRVEVPIASAAAALRKGADPFDDMEECGTLTEPQRVAEQPAEKPDVVAQALMRIADHVRRHKPSLSLVAAPNPRTRELATREPANREPRTANSEFDTMPAP